MSKKRDDLSLSLFPFLAVLICTMGVLVALLLLVVKRAEESATKEQVEVVAQAEQARSEVELLRTEVDFRSQLLEQQRNDRRTELNNQRAILGHLESEMANLRAKSAEIAEQIRSLQATHEAKTDSAGLAESVAAQQQQVESLRAQLESARAAQALLAAGNRRVVQPMYSIVPLATQSGTNRRPIYIECVEDGMYLYPGKIKLTLEDFVLPLTPGNPLDTSLLAYREFWRRNKSSAVSHENAYPLLVVRPSGAKWYSVARRAMSGWDQEFGYELIPEDWQVNFGTADTGLKEHVQQAIDSAKLRQTALVAYGRATPASQVGAIQPAAGVAESGTALIPATSGGFSQAPTTARRAHHTNFGSANSARETGPDPIANFSSQFQSGRTTGPSNSGFDSDAPNESTSLLTSSRKTPTTPNFDEIGQRRGSPAAPRGGPDSNSVPSGRTNGISSSDRRQPGSSQVANLTAPSGGSAGLPPSAASTLTQQSETTKLAADQTKTSPANSANTWHRDSLAHERGADWALPSRRNAVSAYHRPVVVHVKADALVLPAGEGSPKSQTIPLGASLMESVDPLTDAIWQRVDKWGNLGFDGYWKPVLEFRFSPEQAEQAVALQRLLEGSGLDVKMPNGETPYSQIPRIQPREDRR